MKGEGKRGRIEGEGWGGLEEQMRERRGGGEQEIEWRKGKGVKNLETLRSMIVVACSKNPIIP